MWRKFSPYTLVESDNPVFQQEQRRLRWLKTPESLLKYNLIVWIGIPGLILLWWLIERINIRFRDLDPYLDQRLVIITLIVSLGMMILSNCYIVASTLGRSHRQFHAGDWQVVSIMNRGESDILDAKDAIAQIHSWPFIAFEIGLRGVCIIIILLNDFYHRYQNYYPETSAFSRITVLNPGFWIMNGVYLIIGLEVALLPLLRMRVMITWSTFIALQVKNAALAMLTGLAFVLFFHLTQIALIGDVFLLLMLILINDISVIWMGCIILLLPILLPIVLSKLYASTQKIGKNAIRRKVFAPD
jgi:hypothetical protein